MQFSSLRRLDYFYEMENEQYDLVIIGGGITGAGIALDATSRGMKVALVEMQDFAGGTSSRSTKLVHGGLRYLKQLHVKLVAEVGKERAIVYENGPHVTTPEWMVLPLYENGPFGKHSLSMGLRIYDLLADVRRGERRKMLSKDEVVSKVPFIKKEGLLGGGYYVEYRTDDARLTIEVLKKAVEYGANAINYTKVEELLYENGNVVGVNVVDLISGREFSIRARKVVNATGPWVDRIREMEKFILQTQQKKRKKRLQLTKGTHLVFNQEMFPLTQAVYFDYEDGRMIFAIPRCGKIYVGTTDITYQGDLINPRMTVADRDYLLDAIRYIFPELSVKAEHIESSWSGLRPLIFEADKNPSEISRKDEIWVSSSGLITIAGGKLTGYRKMAELVVDTIVRSFNAEKYGTFLKQSQTKTIPLSGGNVGGSVHFERYVVEKMKKGMEFGLSKEEAMFLAKCYGSNVDQLYKIIVDCSRDDAALFGLPPVLFAQLIYSIENEMVVKPVDFFIRRTGALYFHIDWVNEWKKPIIEWMAQKLGWSNEEKAKYSFELEDELRNAVIAVRD